MTYTGALHPEQQIDAERALGIVAGAHQHQLVALAIEERRLAAGRPHRGAAAGALEQHQRAARVGHVRLVAAASAAALVALAVAVALVRIVTIVVVIVARAPRDATFIIMITCARPVLAERRGTPPRASTRYAK